VVTVLRKGVFSCLPATVLALSAVLLTGCFLLDLFDQSYQPATITFDGPPAGTIFPEGTSSVTITGTLHDGDSRVKDLYVKNGALATPIAFDRLTNTFSYEFDLAPIPADVTRTFEISTCTFRVDDEEGKANSERISYVVAEDSLQHGDQTVKEDSVFEVSFTEELLRAAISWAVDLINNALPDLIAGLLPLELDMGSLGKLIIDPNQQSPDCSINDSCGQYGQIALHGDIGMDIFFEPDNTVGASLTVEKHPDASGDELIVIYGIHEDPHGETRTHVQFTADDIIASNIKVQMGINREDKIVASADLSDAEFDIVELGTEYGDLSVPSWIWSLFIDILELILGALPLDNIALLDANPLSLDFGDLGIGDLGNLRLEIDFPERGPLVRTDFQGDATAIAFSLLMDLNTWPDGAADRYVHTPGDRWPGITADPDTEDITLSVSDDLVNQTLLILGQSGLLQKVINSFDLTQEVRNLAPGFFVNSPNLKITAEFGAPLLCDFSTGSTNAGENLGDFHVPNMLIEIKGLKLTPTSLPMHLRIGVDALAGVSLGLSEDMRRIEIQLDINLDDLEVKILYLNPPQGGQVADSLVFLGRGLAAAILDLVIPVAFSLDLPELPIVLPDVALAGNSLLDNSLAIRLDVSL
jgi:hypothetical protein